MEWSLRLPTDFEAEWRRNRDVVSLTQTPVIFGDGMERVVFANGHLIFRGTERTLLGLVIRLPMGILRIVWCGTDLIVEFNYLLTTKGYVRWYAGPESNEMPAATFIDCYGQPTGLLTLRHANNNYVVRIYPEYPPVVIPQREYLMVQLGFLRENSAMYGNSAQNTAGSLRRQYTPRTPSRSPSANQLGNDGTSGVQGARDGFWAERFENVFAAIENEHGRRGLPSEEFSPESRSWRSLE